MQDPDPKCRQQIGSLFFDHIGDLESGFPSLQRGFSEVNCWGLKLWICSLWTFLFQGPASIKSSWRWQKYQSDLNWIQSLKIQSLKYKVSDTKSQIQTLNTKSEYKSTQKVSLRNIISENSSPVIACLFFSSTIPMVDITLSAGFAAKLLDAISPDCLQRCWLFKKKRNLVDLFLWYYFCQKV